MADQDTHQGELQADGIVVAQCGIQFVPRPLPLGGVALPGHPYDRDQICPECHPARRTQ
jgi:hypothetical protein